MLFSRLLSNFLILKTLPSPIQPQFFSRAVTPVHKISVMYQCTVKDVPKVDIDPEGVFKYIQLNVHNPNPDKSDDTFLIIRGYKRHNYHSDIYDEVQNKLKPLDCEPIGGGRISHEPQDKKIHIYGYSQGYGKADHEITAKLVKEAFPEYTVTISDEGY